MTPIIFVSFLVSLVWVEFRYSTLRSHAHDRPPSGGGDCKNGNRNGNRDGNKSDNNSNSKPNSGNGSGCTQHHMPAWLHRHVYRRQPYHYVLVRADGHQQVSDKASADDGTYYHSMQRKLLKMESDEAFRIRTTVLFAMCAAVVSIAWAASTVVRWAAGYFRG